MHPEVPSQTVSLSQRGQNCFLNINIDRAHANEENSELGNGLEAGPPEQRQGWGLQYDYEETHHEKEDVRFEAKGIIRTSDGKDVVFTLRLDMNREYIEKNRMNIGMLANTATAIIAPSSVYFSVANLVIYRGIVFIFSL